MKNLSIRLITTVAAISCACAAATGCGSDATTPTDVGGSGGSHAGSGGKSSAGSAGKGGTAAAGAGVGGAAAGGAAAGAGAGGAAAGSGGATAGAGGKSGSGGTGGAVAGAGGAVAGAGGATAGAGGAGGAAAGAGGAAAGAGGATAGAGGASAGAGGADTGGVAGVGGVAGAGGAAAGAGGAAAGSGGAGGAGACTTTVPGHLLYSFDSAGSDTGWGTNGVTGATSVRDSTDGHQCPGSLQATLPFSAYGVATGELLINVNPPGIQWAPAQTKLHGWAKVVVPAGGLGYLMDFVLHTSSANYGHYSQDFEAPAFLADGAWHEFVATLEAGFDLTNVNQIGLRVDVQGTQPVGQPAIPPATTVFLDDLWTE